MVKSGDPIFRPDGDGGNVFDNNQKLGKTWMIQVNSSLQLSVITTHIRVEINRDGKLQSDTDIKPGVAMMDKAVITKILCL